MEQKQSSAGKIVFGGYLYSQPDSAFYFAQMLYDLAVETNNRKRMVTATKKNWAIPFCLRKTII